MRLLDIGNIGKAVVAKVVAPVKKALAGAPPRGMDPDGELARRAEINARAEWRRAEAERAIFGSGSRWVPRRPGWLESRRRPGWREGSW